MDPKLNLVYWPSGRYVKADDTDIRKTFAKARAEIEKNKAQKVTPITTKRKS